MKNIKFGLCLSVTVALTLGLSIATQELFAAWNPPTANPPAGNTSLPITIYNNLAATQQINSNLTIAGNTGLVVSDGAVIGDGLLVNNGNLTVLSGRTGMGTINPQNRLDVNGGMAVGGYAGTYAAPGNGMIISGNVGIGTNNPQASLHLKSSGDVKFFLTNEDKTAAIQYDAGDDGLEFRLNGTDSSNSKLYIGDNGNVAIGSIRNANIDLAIGDNDTGLQQQGDGELAIYTNNAERMRFASAGNVGIGITNPAADLVIKKDDRPQLSLVSTETNLGMRFEYHEDQQELRIQGADSTGEYNSGTLMTVQRGGNVGIGTDNPNVDLHIENAQNTFTGIRVKNVNTGNNSSAGIIFEDENSALGLTAGMAVYDDGAPNANDLFIFNIKDDIILQPANTKSVLVDGKVTIKGTLSGENGLIISGNGGSTDGRIQVWGANGFDSEIQIYERTNGISYGYEWEVDGDDDKIYLKAEGYSCCDGKLLMAATKSGKFGFGMNVNDSSSYLMSIDGNGWILGSWTESSDARFKKNIRTLDMAMEKVDKLNGVFFEWNKENFPDMNFKEGVDIGLIAQDVAAVIPEVVSEDPQGYLGISYERLVPLLINAIKELKQEKDKEIENLKRIVCLDHPEEKFCE
ncbi:MAG: tail fiber domain-containing protein [bacterium]